MVGISRLFQQLGRQERRSIAFLFLQIKGVEIKGVERIHWIECDENGGEGGRVGGKGE